MKLYYAPGACSLASDIVLHELELSAEFVKVDLKAKRTENGDDFKRINPKGYVPCLKLDDGDTLTENIAVLSYLASLKPSLLPQEGMAKWHGIESLAFVSTELHKSFKPLFDATSGEEQKQKAKNLVSQRLGLLDANLQDRALVVGDSFTVVDAYLYVMLLWSKKFDITLPDGLSRYAKALSERPAVRAALANEGLKNSF